MKDLEVVPVEEGDASLWMQMLAREWAADWNDPREDTYTLDDGEAVEAKGSL